MDKIEKIKAELKKRIEDDTLSNYMRSYYNGLLFSISDLEEFAETLPEEPVSGDLEKAAKHYLYSNILYDDVYVGNPTDKDCIEMFKAGANWQKQQMMKEAVEAECFGSNGNKLYSHSNYLIINILLATKRKFF